MTHTKGNLYLDTAYTDGSFTIKESEHGRVVCSFNESQITNPHTERANAIRLVACWNALLPVPTEWLEKFNMDSIENVAAENARLREERDAALAVLKQLTEWSDQYPANRTYAYYRADEIASALTKINGEALNVLAKHKMES